MNIYDFTQYKQALKQIVLDSKKKNSNFTFENLANHCGVQKTYLSKVLNKEGHLSADQFYLAQQLIRKKLRLSDSQLEFLELLYLFDTSSVAERKAVLQSKITKAKAHSSQTEKMIAVDHLAFNNHIKEEYHTDPYYSLIHMFLTIDKYAADITKISEALSISKLKVSRYLAKMAEWGLVKLENKKYVVIRDDIHLPKESSIYMNYRNLMNQFAINKMNAVEDEDFYSFSVVFTCDEKVNAKIRQRFFTFLKDVQGDVKKAKAEDVYQLNFNLLKWS